jgi:hypothetical protein
VPALRSRLVAWAGTSKGGRTDGEEVEEGQEEGQEEQEEEVM